MSTVEEPSLRTATAPTVRDDAASRQERLVEAARRLRTRATAADPARVLFVAGSILVPLGFVFVLLGWWGAARTTDVWEQIPYVISGGLLGLGLVFAGGFCYFAYWLTELVHTARRDAKESLVALERIEELLNDRGNGSSRTRRAVATTASAFVATPSGTMYHRPDCLAVRDKDGARPVPADGDGLTPCGICQPDLTR